MSFICVHPFFASISPYHCHPLSHIVVIYGYVGGLPNLALFVFLIFWVELYTGFGRGALLFMSFIFPFLRRGSPPSFVKNADYHFPRAIMRVSVG